MADFEVHISDSLRRLLSMDVGRIAAEAANEAAGYGLQVISADTPVDTGQTRLSWIQSKEATPNDPEAIVSNNKPNVLALEYGSEVGGDPWPGPGPKTEIAANEQNSGTVVSSQAPAGMVRKNLAGIQQVFETGLRRRIGNV